MPGKHINYNHKAETPHKLPTLPPLLIRMHKSCRARGPSVARRHRRRRRRCRRRRRDPPRILLSTRVTFYKVDFVPCDSGATVHVSIYIKGPDLLHCIYFGRSFEIRCSILVRYNIM